MRALCVQGFYEGAPHPEVFMPQHGQLNQRHTLSFIDHDGYNVLPYGHDDYIGWTVYHDRVIVIMEVEA